MSARIFSYPIEFEPNSTNPKNPQVFDAAQDFCQQEFGHHLDLNPGKAWAVVKPGESGPDVIGLSQLVRSLDIPTFHVAKALETGEREKDEAALQEVRTARDLLTGRMWSYIQDTMGTGQLVTVRVAPEVERYWKSYLRLIRAEKANRYILQV